METSLALGGIPLKGSDPQAPIFLAFYATVV